MSLAEQKLSDLKKRYIWSRENLPSFDFEHFLVREACPVVFTSPELAHHVYSIICWDTGKFETNEFKAQFDRFFVSASCLAKYILDHLPKKETEIRKAFSDYEYRYPQIVLSHPFIIARNALCPSIQDKYSRKWTVDILTLAQDKAAYIEKRFAEYDTIDQRISWAEDCLLPMLCILEALDTTERYTKTIDELLRVYREIKELLSNNYPSDYGFYMDFYTCFLSHTDNPDFSEQKHAFPIFHGDVSVMERDFLYWMDDLMAHVPKELELQFTKASHLMYGEKTLKNLTKLEIPFCKKMFELEKEAKIQTTDIEEAVYGQVLADQGERLKGVIKRLNKKVEADLGLSHCFSFGKDFIMRHY